MQRFFLIFIFSAPFLNLYSQTFVNAKDSIFKNPKEQRIYEYIIEAPKIYLDQEKNDSVKIVVNDKSSFPPSDYEIIKHIVSLDELVKNKFHSFFIKINEDSLPDRSRELIIDMKLLVYDSTNNLTKVIPADQLEIAIMPYKKPDKPTFFDTGDYQYLAYLGTNFDLVDGIKAKNLFFATNIYIPPRHDKKGGGYYLSLYGNRAITSIDSSFIENQAAQRIRLSDTAARVYYEEATRLRSSSTDNIGAYTSALFKMGSLSKQANLIRLFFAPSIEFIWRRTTTTVNYRNRTIVDSVMTYENLDSEFHVPRDNSTISNQFLWSIGPGFFLAHENDRISVRVHMSTGYTHFYIPSSLSQSDNYTSGGADIFFSGRAWITEAKSGITLQAEITNTFFTPRPFYVVTLSKAIDFGNFGTLFQPVVKK